MTMPMVEGGRPIARFRLFGFPVTVDISFVVIIAILGWVPGRTTVTSFVVWLVMVPLAVLVHELGHAFVARTTGAAPAITLAGLGGLTSYVPPAPVSRARSIAISVAGPAVGIVVGLGLLAYARGVGVGDGLAQDVVDTAIFTTLGWSVLNLLPILPLDGGQTLRELLPGSPAKREVRAAMVSIVVAVLAAAGRAEGRAGVRRADGGVLRLQQRHDGPLGARPGEGGRQPAAVQLLWAGRSDDARELLAEQPADAAVHPLVRAAVRAAGDDSFGARRELESAAGRNPADPTAASLLLLSHRIREDWPAVRDLVAAGAAVDPGTVLAAQTVAFRSGATRASAEIGQAWLDHLAAGAVQGDLPGRSPTTSPAAGPPPASCDRGLAAFQRAADLGFADLTEVDSDDDIAPLRPLPGYDEARQQIRRRALAAAGPERVAGGLVAGALAGRAPSPARRCSCAGRCTSGRPSMCSWGRSRPSQRGSHQFARPSRCITDGTSSIRTTVASMKIADAMPTPITLRTTSGLGMNAANTATMIAAAAVMTRPVPASPSRMARWLSPVRSHASRIRLTRNTS